MPARVICHRVGGGRWVIACCVVLSLVCVGVSSSLSVSSSLESACVHTSCIPTVSAQPALATRAETVGTFLCFLVISGRDRTAGLPLWRHVCLCRLGSP